MLASSDPCREEAADSARDVVFFLFFFHAGKTLVNGQLREKGENAAPLFIAPGRMRTRAARNDEIMRYSQREGVSNDKSTARRCRTRQQLASNWFRDFLPLSKARHEAGDQLGKTHHPN